MVRPVINTALQSSRVAVLKVIPTDDDDNKRLASNPPSSNLSSQPPVLVLTPKQPGPFAFLGRLLGGAIELAAVASLAGWIGTQAHGLIQRARTHEILKTPLNQVPEKVWNKINSFAKGIVDIADPNNINIGGKSFTGETSLGEALRSLLDPKTYPDLINQLKATLLEAEPQSNSNASSKVNASNPQKNYLHFASSLDSYIKNLDSAKTSGDIEQQAAAYHALGNHILSELAGNNDIATSQVALMMRSFNSAGNAEQQLEQVKSFMQSDKGEAAIENLLIQAKSISDSARNLAHVNGERVPYHAPEAVVIS